MTSTSLFARAIALPASIAASTASSAAVPDDAHNTMSTSGRIASATSPSEPWPAISAPLQTPRRRRESTARPDAIAIARGRCASTCSANSATFVARGHGDHLETIAMRLDDRQGAAADRPGRSENGKAFHG